MAATWCKGLSSFAAQPGGHKTRNRHGAAKAATQRAAHGATVTAAAACAITTTCREVNLAVHKRHCSMQLAQTARCEICCPLRRSLVALLPHQHI